MSIDTDFPRDYFDSHGNAVVDWGLPSALAFPVPLASKSASAAEGAMPSRLRVLVTSSDLENRRALESLLSECGLDPVLTSTLEETQSLLAKRDISLVFCDAQLAEGTFRDLLRLTEAASIPVVVASRVHETRQYLEAMRLGAFDFVASPYRRSEVEHIVASALHRPVAAAVGALRGSSAASR